METSEAIANVAIAVRRVAPLTWGGIIGNFSLKFKVTTPENVAPLTWGGIIGNISRWMFANSSGKVAPLTWGGIIGNGTS